MTSCFLTCKRSTLKGKNFMWNKFFPFRKDNHPERAKTNSNRPQGYKAFSMLNSAEHKICPANKSQITNNSKFFGAEHS